MAFGQNPRPLGTDSTYRIVPQEGQALREQLISIVRGRVEASERYAQPFRRKLPEYYDLWRGFSTGNWAPTKNNIWIPLIYSTIWSDVARKVATAFAQWPVVTFSGYGPDDEPVARKQEALINAQLMDADIINKEISTFLSADLYGTSVSMLMWDHREETRRVTDFQAHPISQEMVRTLRSEIVTTFDGPNYRVVDLLDFFPQPGFKEINGTNAMQWCAVRYYLDIDDCEFLASEAGGFVFDPDEVAQLKRSDSGLPSRIDEALLRRFEANQGIQSTAYMKDKYSRPVELIEMWGKIPSEFAHLFGGSFNVVMTMANRKYLFRAADTPFNHRQKPFIKYSPTPDPHYFFAPGKAEIAHQLQIAGNRFINHQLDAADLLVHPMWMYDRNKGINTRQLWAAPGRLFGVDGSPEGALMPVPMDFRNLNVGSGMTNAMFDFIQMGTGIQDDTIMGLAGEGSDRQTAREFLGRREASGTRLMLESVMYDADYLEKLANFFCAMDTQFLDVPREVLVLGDAALNDPVTGEPIQSNRLQIDAETLNFQYAARANGSTMTMSRESEKANMLAVFQTLAAAQPMVAGSINMVNFLRQMLRTLGFKNVNELIQKQPSIQEMMAQQGMEGMQGDVSQVPSDGQGMLQLIGGGAPSGPMSGVPGM